MRTDLLGRDAELARLDAAVDRVREGGGALTVRGEAGIGKSALLEHARERARAQGARTLVTVGTESEAELAFAGLHELLRPISRGIETLPDPQRRALEAAFGIADELEPELFHVALAAYRLICEAADAGPLVLTVDDAQWLDQASLRVLAFVARRLENEPVLLLAGLRDGYPDELRLPALPIARLDEAAAGALLVRHAPDLTPQGRARVLALAAGNPLGLVELARARLDPAAPVTLTARLERAFAARLDEVGEDTRRVLLAAALDRGASLDEILQAAETEPHALDAAVAAGLIDGAVRFRHPLIRSAVEQAAPPAQVLATYARLAGAVADPERRLWHRAMATVGTDEALADGLEAHAERARRRGAVTVAAAALERAAALTADPRTRSARQVRGAELAYELGLIDVVRRLLDQAQPGDDLENARLAWLQEMVAGDLWFETGATKTFVAIAERMRDGGDPDMALRSLVPIAHRCWWTRSRPRTRAYLVQAAESMGFPEDDPRLLAVIALADPEVTGPAVLERIPRLQEPSDPVQAMYAGIAAEKAGDFALGARLLARAVDRLREQSMLGMLSQALVHYAWAATNCGAWEAAAAAASEGARLARDTRQPQHGLTGELIAALAGAHRGEDPEPRLARPERALMAANSGPLLATAHLARGAAALGEGRHEDAFRHLWPVFDEHHPAYHRFMREPAVLDLAEAGRGEHAEQVAEVLTDMAPEALQVICARAVLADDEALYREALELDLSPFPRARVLFAHGSHLRRQRRSAASRAPLRAAGDLFAGLGAVRWADRARQELRASGERLGPRGDDVRQRLTAQELQIARLAADGLSNREIGERLFLSPRTIGSHLYRIFPKLEITSRGQLKQSLDSSEAARGA